MLLVLASAWPASAEAQTTTAFVGATLWDGSGSPPIPGATLVVSEGRVVSVGTQPPPAGADVVDVTGRWIIPGLINAHGHVSGRWAPSADLPEPDRYRADLALYAWYGVTTVNSLGGEATAAVDVRAEEEAGGLDRARLLFAGAVVTGSTQEAVRTVVDRNAAMGADWIKFRVDDNLGATRKMPPEVYRAIIERAHEHDLRAAAHLFYLDDAKDLLNSGVDLVAHSVRDQPVDAELIRLLTDRDVCYVPTLTREVSTFVYADRPSFFDDPFFQARADATEVARVSTPGFQENMAGSASAAGYRAALAVAESNLDALVAGGVTVALGTDSGPAARFPGYFEHMELEMMVQAGLSPEQALRSATGQAADCLGIDSGVLASGRRADFLVLSADPLREIRNTRSIEDVVIAGVRIQR